jgi:glutaminyl-tRNA synthetase
VLEDCVREDLNERSPRAFAVLDPLKLVIDNWPAGHVEQAEAPVHPQRPELGKRTFPISGELWIEREDYSDPPPKGYFRLYPGNTVRLRFGYVIKCTGADKDAAGNVIAVHCDYLPETKSGTPGSDSVKVKGNIHWLSAAHACEAEVRLYDRLFNAPFPGSKRGRETSDDTLHARESLPGAAEQEPDAVAPPADLDFIDDLNPDSKRTIRAYVEPGLANAAPEQRFQFERHGYFVADLRDARPGRPVFNRTVTLRDSWVKQGGK